MAYDLSNSDKIRNKVVWNSLKYSIPKLLVNFIGYFGSLVTIFSIKFIVNGTLAFNASKPIDWFLLCKLPHF